MFFLYLPCVRSVASLFHRSFRVSFSRSVGSLSVSGTNAHAHAAACVHMLRWGGALLTTRWACIPLITSSLAFTWGLYHVLDSWSLTPLFSLFISCFIYFSPAFHASKTTNTCYNIEPRSAHSAFISCTLQQKSTRKTPIRMQAHMSSYSIVW